MSTDFQSIIKEAEQAVQLVKDPALKAVAFGKVIEALIGHDGSPSLRPRRLQRRHGVAQAGKKSGTSGVLQELVDQEFFKSQRSLSDIKTELANGGHHVPITSLSGPMQALCKRRILRREKKTIGNKQTYVYSNW
jgi:hypothetical protein